MPKHKTRKTIAKRLKITSRGKILHMAQNDQHRKSHKSKRLRRSYHKPRILGAKETILVKRYIHI